MSVYGAEMMEIDMAYEIREAVEDGTTVCPHARERLGGSGMKGERGMDMELWGKWRKRGRGGSAGRDRRIGYERLY